MRLHALTLLLTLALSVPGPGQTACGDCDRNGAGPDILDSLTAAQLGVGILTPLPGQVHACDIDVSGTVTVLDALLMAQAAAGLPISFMCAGEEPPQTATLSVDLTTGIVTVVTPPSLLTLTGAGTYDAMAMQLTIGLSVRNDFPRLLNSLKAVVTSLNEGAATGSGTYGGDPYVYYGPLSVAAGATVMRDIVVSGVTGAVDPILVDLRFENHQLMFLSGGQESDQPLVDSSGSGEQTIVDTVDTAFYGTIGGRGMTLGGVVSPDGRWLYLGSRTQPTITCIDLTTLLPVTGVDLTGTYGISFDGLGAVGHTADINMSPDGQFLYVPLTIGDHRYRQGRTARGLGSPEHIEIVKVQRATLMEVSRVRVLDRSLNNGRGRRLTLTDDGTLAAYPVVGDGVVFLVDLVAMTVVDADPMTPGEQGFDVSGTSMESAHAAITADGSQIYVCYAEGDGTIDVIDVSTGAISPLAPPTLTCRPNRPGFLSVGPDGRVYYGRISRGCGPGRVGLSIYDPAAMTWTELMIGNDAHGIAFDIPRNRYLVFDDDIGGGPLIVIFELGTDTPLPFPATGAMSISPPGVSYGHTFLITPY